MMDGFRIDQESAILMAPLPEAAMRQLAACRPASLELMGDWSDLAPLADVAADVRHLYIAGDVSNGRIKRIEGLERFASLASLRIASAVKGGYDIGLLPALESLDVVWQAEAEAAFRHPMLRSLVLKSFPGKDFRSVEVSGRSRLAKLWLAKPKLELLDGIGRLGELRDLRITDARELASLGGMNLPELTALDVENAKNLVDVSSLALSPRLETLRLNSISAKADLDVLKRLPALQRLQVGGAAPDVDWLALVGAGDVRRIFAWWDPEKVGEQAIRQQTEQAGRAVQRFEPVPGRGRRPLLLELD